MIKDQQQLFKIGDVADAVRTTIRAIRYYEEEGLIIPLRSEGGTRLYSQRHIDRLRAILRLTENGFPLAIIKTLAETRQQHRTGNDSQQAISHQLDEMLNGIHAQIKQLQGLSKLIGATKKTVQQCAGCKNKPTSEGCPDCPVKTHLADIELLNLVWDQES
jgi:MerR family transcriptional regulator, Zn(II)-responsive regulator of zntA